MVGRGLETESAVHRATREARAAYGRLLASLAARSGDVAAAEDALSEAFRIALETWPDRGIPPNPAGWLLATARNRRIDALRRARKQEALPEDLDAIGSIPAPDEADGYPDDRLKLLFVCAHPSIDAAMHTPLMLQTVLGLDAERIARAFVMPPAAMAQRLVRVKRKIKEAHIPFEILPPQKAAERVEAVRDAIYAAYTSHWDEDPGKTSSLEDLGGETLFLADLLTRLLPSDPETLGLSALMAFCEARKPARRTPEGRFVPLDEQDPGLWDQGLIRHAERCLFEARTHRSFGRYQLEAAIQSVHVDRARSGATDWEALTLLHEALFQIAPSLGGAISRAVAIGNGRGPAAGLAALAQLDVGAVENHQPFWAARAHLCAAGGDFAAARAAFDQAIRLSGDPAVAAYLAGRRAAIGG